jgi:surface antigen
MLLPRSAGAAPINCVQFVERTTQMALHGNAWQWWESAADQYARGRQPRPKAVMVFAKGGRLRFGHLAIVTSQLDRRTVLVDHANWSPSGGRRGRIEYAVRIVDVSPANDWSQVRVWYGPTSDIGQTIYAVHGFVYPSPATPTAKAWETDPLSNHIGALALGPR